MNDTRSPLAAAIASIAMPYHMTRRPISKKGFPVPYFVAWIDLDGQPVREGYAAGGEPDFRVVDTNKMRQCLTHDRCWLCGQTLGKWRSLVLSPMCLLTGTSPDPDSHTDCAEYAARACPFLARPRAQRNAVALPPDVVASPFGLARNPGAMCLFVHWQRRLRRHPQSGRMPLFVVPDLPRRLTFWAEGRRASRAEVLRSIATGLAPVRAMAESQGADALDEFEYRHRRTLKLVEQWTDDFDPRAIHEGDRAAAAVPSELGRLQPMA